MTQYILDGLFLMMFVLAMIVIFKNDRLIKENKRLKEKIAALEEVIDVSRETQIK